MELIRQPKIENVRMLDRLIMATQSRSISTSGVLGTLYLTATHLIFVDNEGRNETWVLHSHLSSIEKSSVSSIGTPLHIKCKNFQSITFILPREKDAHEVWTSLFNLSQPLTYEDLYCFRYSASNEPFKDHRSLGWSKFDLLSEFRRQGVPNRQCFICDLNRNYELCESYPKILFVPSTATESMIRSSASFRSKGRLPVLSYLHSSNGAVICRCSQPLSGFNSRCEDDEALLDCILRTKESSRVLYVVDTRPRVSGLMTSFVLTLQTLPSPVKSIYHLTTTNVSSSGGCDNDSENSISRANATVSSPSTRSSSPSKTTTTTSHHRRHHRHHHGHRHRHRHRHLSCVSTETISPSSTTEFISPPPAKYSHSSGKQMSTTTNYANNNKNKKSRRRRHRSAEPNSTTTTTSTSNNATSYCSEHSSSSCSNTTQYSTTFSTTYTSLLTASSATSKKLISYSSNFLNKMNAYANKATGKGFENENFYENIKFNFFGIENIHVMRGSLNKLIEASQMFNQSSFEFIGAIESSGWLKHIKSVLEAAAFVVKAIREGISVVIHCSDGWDRTAQTCSIASLLLDPHYRTFNGFQALIEKEWLAFGHKFTDRCGHIQTGDTKETAPVFTQFVDCIWQILQQFPSEFEFNERFLLLLHDHIYSCQFGNFIGNTDKERYDLKIKERTYSLWAYLDSRRDLLTNPIYYVKRRAVLGGSDDLSEQILTLDTSPQSIRYWTGFYNRFESGVHPRESISDLMVVTYNHILSLERHVKYLEKRLKEKEKIRKRKFVQSQHQQQLQQTLVPHDQEHQQGLQKEKTTDVPPSCSSTQSQLAPSSYQQQILSTTNVISKLDNESTTITTTKPTLSDFLLVESSRAKKLSDSSRGSSSFDSIDYPLKIVKQCMERLEIKHREEAEMQEAMLKQQEESETAEGGDNISSNSTTSTGGISVTKLTSTDFHPLDGSIQTSTPVSRADREKLRLDDLKVVYPEGLRLRQGMANSTNVGSTSTNQTSLPDVDASQRKQRLPSLEELDESQLKHEMESVAIEWESIRVVTECPCGFPFDQMTPRKHCYSCGRLHCVRCIDRKTILPGHVVRSTGMFSEDDDLSATSTSSDVFESPEKQVGEVDTVSVCRSCYRTILEKDSFTSPS